MSYETDITKYAEIVDKLSPYHLYHYLYWNLRKKWRLILYKWTRRKACDARAKFTPNKTIAGKEITVNLEIEFGQINVITGGRIAVYFPMNFGGSKAKGALSHFQCPKGMTGYGSRIVAFSEKKDVKLETIVHSTGTVFTCVEVIVKSGKFTLGDKVNIVIGDPSCKPSIIGESAKTYVFRVAIDQKGDGEFRPVKPNPAISNVGNIAHFLRIFAPATPKINKPFPIKVVAADDIDKNPSYNYQGKIKFLDYTSKISGPKQVTINKNAHGVFKINNIKVSSKKNCHLTAIDENNGIMGCSNPICSGFCKEPYSVYFGEIHSHTDISDGVGTPEDSLIWARDVEGLDFSALADHFEDGQSYNYTLEEKWEITKKVIKKYNKPNEFVTLLGYEIGTLARHRNVYFSDGKGRMIVEGPEGERVTMDNVFQKLEGTDYILIPHAPKFHGIDWNTPHNPDRQRLIEIYSTWGDSEDMGPLSVKSGLNQGYKFGFTAGTDNHSAQPGKKDLGGITGVYAKNLTRKDIFEALMSRRTFATTGSRMLIYFSVNDAIMGCEVTVSPNDVRYIIGKVIAEEQISLLQVIRNGEIVYEQKQKTCEAKIEWQDNDKLAKLCPKRSLTADRFVYYYLRVETLNHDIGWSSPVWVHG